ncbi:3'-5' exonuclease [Candidatus Pacearchaeota archaeon]|nr:3'-5' exonuclease [Candidatus Pacearchaeota archaeon]
MNRLIIDTETTGLSPNFNKTLTVGLLLIDVEKTHLDILAQNHIFIKHKNYNINPQALKVNGINIDEHNLHACPPSKACSQINTFIKKNSLQKTPIVGHNIHFDKAFLNSLFQQGETKPIFHDEYEDTIKIWKELQKKEIIPSHLRATLGTLATHFDIDYEKAHDALADCKITAQVYHEMLKLK